MICVWEEEKLKQNVLVYLDLGNLLIVTVKLIVLSFISPIIDSRYDEVRIYFKLKCVLKNELTKFVISE